MPQDKPRYRLQALVPDPEAKRKEQRSLADKARAAFRGKPESENASRAKSMLRQSDEMRDYDLPGSVNAARKAELLSRSK